jgi:hypothetical protein
MVDREKYKIVEIGGKKFEFGMLPVVQSANLLFKMRKIVSGAAKGIGGMDVADFKGLADISSLDNAGSLGEVAANFIDALDENLFEHVAGKIISITEIQDDAGAWRDINIVGDFHGQTMNYIKLIVLGLRYNYADFFDGLGSIFAKMPGAKTEQSQPEV